jgi:hypothetical protein
MISLINPSIFLKSTLKNNDPIVLVKALMGLKGFEFQRVISCFDLHRWSLKAGTLSGVYKQMIGSYRPLGLGLCR